MTEGYDPQKSRIADDKLADFLRAPLTGVITEAPGIGEAAAKHSIRTYRSGQRQVMAAVDMM